MPFFVENVTILPGTDDIATCEVWKNRGANLISLGADTDYLINGAKQALGNLKKTFR